MPTVDIVEGIAQITHEMNRRWCELGGDDSQLPWEQAPEWQRQSARNGVRFHIENPNASASAAHDNWVAEKVAAGWVYGPIKDAEASPPTHPCLVPFEELPPRQQFKDRLFRTIANTLFSEVV